MKKFEFNGNNSIGEVTVPRGQKINFLLKISAEVGGNLDITHYKPTKITMTGVESISVDNDTGEYVIKLKDGKFVNFSPKK